MKPLSHFGVGNMFFVRFVSKKETNLAEKMGFFPLPFKKIVCFASKKFGSNFSGNLPPPQTKNSGYIPGPVKRLCHS